MSNNWKNRVDAEHTRREEEAERMSATEKERAMEIHRQRFKCHVCGKSSEKMIEATAGGKPYLIGYPDDLVKCDKCRELTCEEHIYKGICKTCAEKL